ncbi:MAG: Sua5 YciO YrdC YwlC family protein [Halarcobacter sp.]
MDSSLVYLVQTDTTVGFSSSDDEKLCLIKNRPTNQKTLQTVDSFKTLKLKTRVPKLHKKRVRNSKKTTFIYPNSQSFRVISRDDKYYSFISKFKVLYSSSANLTKKSFDFEFASKSSDVVVFTKEGFSEKTPSSIYKLYKNKLKRIR